MADRYVEAVDYVLTYLAGYLGQRPHDNLVLIVIGDHQPPASVSGPDASWDVPVHVIARDPTLIEALRAEGFTTGLEPARSAIGPMNQLAARLLRVFGGTPSARLADQVPHRAAAAASAGALQPRIDVAGPAVHR